MEDFGNPGLVTADDCLHAESGYKELNVTPTADMNFTTTTSLTSTHISVAGMGLAGPGEDTSFFGFARQKVGTPLHELVVIDSAGLNTAFATIVATTTATLASLNAIELMSFSRADVPSGFVWTIAAYAQKEDASFTTYSVSRSFTYTNVELDEDIV